MSFKLNLSDDCMIERPILIAPATNIHKYNRGHAIVISGPALSTGASRLAAQAALAVGAGLVSILGEQEVLHEHAAHVTAIMLKRRDNNFSEINDKVNALAIGPAAGVGSGTCNGVLALLERKIPIVLDADALTSFADDRDDLITALHGAAVLTPHKGEFRRLFPDLNDESHLDAAAAAAKLCNAVVLLKGVETIIAAPDGRHAINIHASPWLATAGSGDVLTGMICGVMAQGIPAFDAACIAAWLHGDIGVRHGPGLTADRMADVIPFVLRGCLRE
jgi:ADP-dependent NAD(P)H-hydrate dehydratase / NAD(P)H-hydrate epimerase